MMSDFVTAIDDGYTYEGYIAENTLHPAVRLKYRRAVYIRSEQIREKYTRAPDAAARANLVIATIKKFLQEWDLLWHHGPDKGKPVPIKPEAIAMQESNILDRTYEMILRMSSGDIDPDSMKSVTRTAEELDLFLSGEGEEVADAKNSEAA
jgi:hypothetical protein